MLLTGVEGSALSTGLFFGLGVRLAFFGFDFAVGVCVPFLTDLAGDLRTDLADFGVDLVVFLGLGARADFALVLAFFVLTLETAMTDRVFGVPFFFFFISPPQVAAFSSDILS